MKNTGCDAVGDDVCGVVLNQCCIEGMKGLDDESVDIIICDPFIQNSSGGNFKKYMCIQ